MQVPCWEKMGWPVWEVSFEDVASFLAGQLSRRLVVVRWQQDSRKRRGGKESEFAVVDQLSVDWRRRWRGLRFKPQLILHGRVAGLMSEGRIIAVGDVHGCALRAGCAVRT